MAWKPDYVTLAEQKDFMHIEPDDTIDDVALALDITAASRAVDDATGRQFGRATAETRTYTATYDRHLGVYRAIIDDLPTTSAFVVLDPNGSTVSASNYTLGPVNAVAKGSVYTHIDLPSAGDYLMTGYWGWNATPSAVKLATHIQASRFAARRDSPYGIAGSPDSGSEMRLLARLDPDVAVILKDYTRRRWAG